MRKGVKNGIVLHSIHVLLFTSTIPGSLCKEQYNPVFSPILLHLFSFKTPKFNIFLCENDEYKQYITLIIETVY